MVESGYVLYSLLVGLGTIRLGCWLGYGTFLFCTLGLGHGGGLGEVDAVLVESHALGVRDLELPHLLVYRFQVGDGSVIHLAVVAIAAGCSLAVECWAGLAVTPSSCVNWHGHASWAIVDDVAPTCRGRDGRFVEGLLTRATIVGESVASALVCASERKRQEEGMCGLGILLKSQW